MNGYADRFEQWAQQYKRQGLEEGGAQGMQKGIAKGEALLLQRQLARRFGALSHEQLEWIAQASTTQLESWGDRVLDALSLEDVFRS